MRIKTPINKRTVSEHLTYHGWKYLLIIALAWIGWSIIYQMTAYRSPQNKRIDVFILSASTTSETVNAFMEPIWQETAPDMELVEAEVLIPIDDYTTQSVVMTRMMTGEKDIAILTEEYFKNYATGGALLPLDSLIADGTIDVSGVNVTNGYMTVVTEEDANGQPTKTERHLYGIPLEGFNGFFLGTGLDTEGLYASIVVANGNDENVIPFFNALLKAGREYTPETQTE